ncbi:MAG: hypothetical protein U9Q78_07540 [Chloroflexota bacterium]|nr:hypothetical protein [Chloroflexota bacterium]
MSAKSVPDPLQQNARLGGGVNLGNALEAPEEGKWRVTLEKEYFQPTAEAGFEVYNKSRRAWNEPVLETLIP